MYICKGIFDLRIYVAVAPPYTTGQGVTRKELTAKLKDGSLIELRLASEARLRKDPIAKLF